MYYQNTFPSTTYVNICVAWRNRRYILTHFLWYIRLYNVVNLLLQVPLPPTEIIVLVQNDISGG